MPEGLIKLGFMVANKRCNANCSFCAGKVHRTDTPPPFDRFIEILHDSPNLREVTLSGAGEPMLHLPEVFHALNILRWYPNVQKIKLYTNGTCSRQEQWDLDNLQRLRNSGLTHMHLSVHHLDPHRNRQSLQSSTLAINLFDFARRLALVELQGRVNCLLIKGLIDTPEKLGVVRGLCDMLGLECAAWGVRGTDDKREDWAKATFPDLVDPVYDETKQTLFPDGTLRHDWC
jgi:molybdenum cofactor biosynthesis enzyme MoaA